MPMSAGSLDTYKLLCLECNPSMSILLGAIEITVDHNSRRITFEYHSEEGCPPTDRSSAQGKPGHAKERHACEYDLNEEKRPLRILFTVYNLNGRIR